ncbi:MAG: arsenic efflux protein [Clostridia bacterium]|nr:arsenic efflux protein [Clostridia bacterium]
MTFNDFLHVLLHSVLDSLIVFPFLIITYIIIELIERKALFFRNGKLLSGKNAPLLAGALGIFPQCGFSVMSAKLYENNLIKVGTLLAVFIATSDEAFAILLTNGQFLPLAMLLILKFVCALAVGYLVNVFIKSKIFVKYKKFTFTHEEYCTQCGNSKNAKNLFEAYFLYPILHALKTLLFIFIVNFVFALLIELIGEERILAFMAKGKYLGPFVTAIIGLIPNCASSILITQFYVNGGITFGSLFAGLSANAGIGLAVVLKNKNKVKSGLLILLSLYLISVAIGLILNLFI